MDILPVLTSNNTTEDLKGITTRSGNAYQGPTIPTTSSSHPKVVEHETKVTRDTVPPTSNGSTKDIQPSVVQIETPIPNFEPVVAPNKLSLPELSPTCITLELVDRLISRPFEVAKDVYVKVGTFHFLTDFVVVEFDANPQVPLILGRSFLKTECALIDVYEGELTLRVEYSQEVLGFSVSGNPTPSTKPIVSNSSPTLTPFGDSDFLLKETDAFLAIDDEPILPEIDGSYYDSEGDILLLREILNDDPSSPPLPPQELKVVEPTTEKSSIDEPPMAELKDLPPHLEYAFLEDFEMATNGNDDDVPPPGGGDLPIPDLRTMKEFIKVNGVTDDALRLYLFPHSLTHHATALFDRLPRNSITTFEQMAKMFLKKYFPPSMVTNLRNEITNFHQRPDESLFEAWECYKLLIDCFPNQNMLPVTQIDTFYNGLTLRHRDTINATAGGTFMKRRPEECYDLIKNMTAHHNDWDTSVQRSYQAPVHQAPIPKPQVVTTTEFTNYMKANDDILKIMQTNMTSLTNFNLEFKNMFGQFMKMNTASSSGLKTLPSNTITNLNEDLKGITTRSGNAYKGPMIPTTSSSPKVVKCETDVTKDTVPPTNNGSTKDVQPLVIQTETLIPNSEPVAAPIVEPVVAPVSAPKPNPKPLIPYPSRLHDQKLCDKANDQKEKFFKIFQDLDFNISFVDALILMPNFGPTIKKKLGGPSKFLIPCDFSGMDECLALADLGASINLMPLSVWNKLSLPELSPTCMTLELADRSISRPVGVAEDVFVKVGTFHFPADFVVVDFDADPRIPLILERSFLKTGRALIDVYEGELTLHFGKEAVTFNLDRTSRYSANYDNIDFLLEETDAFLAIDDEPISPEIDESYYDSEGDILLLEEFLNDDPSPPPLPPQELKVIEPTNEKSSIDEPPVVELKDLPPHLEYLFLEGDDKLPVIISKDLKDEEKTALIKVLKSHKQALAWQLSDIKGINPEFCTHKILMADDFKPAVQHQRRVNPKIHEVIKKEVLKLLDA
nr:reverse transcriptase domain-containing protein [Tanacetum cinerariifolium]